jgi:hypothetical protein
MGHAEKSHLWTHPQREASRRCRHGEVELTTVPPRSTETWARRRESSRRHLLAAGTATASTARAHRTTQHNTTQSRAARSHVHRHLARCRRHPHGARQLRSQAQPRRPQPRRPQPHGSRSVGPPRTKPKPDSDQSRRHRGNTAGREPTSPSSPCRACHRGRSTTPPLSCEEGLRHHRREEGRQPESPPPPCCLPPSAAAKKSAARPAPRPKTQAPARWRGPAATPPRERTPRPRRRLCRPGFARPCPLAAAREEEGAGKGPGGGELGFLPVATRGREGGRVSR